MSDYVSFSWLSTNYHLSESNPNTHSGFMGRQHPAHLISLYDEIHQFNVNQTTTQQIIVSLRLSLSTSNKGSLGIAMEPLNTRKNLPYGDMNNRMSHQNLHNKHKLNRVPHLRSCDNLPNMKPCTSRKMTARYTPSRSLQNRAMSC